ncbi:glycerol-3-phosphate dehydrogenase [Desulfobaculum xiamenense]|uniref:Glycerol-3-phosphate dehydrogenase n=1 Tax=Desulfobaculum xiamenense TaxID=995050 RepID=A0A846QQD0_9BACT|nr:anaerobic glycerol-3-phosphate dehydrogenase subunit A [Desulfobaculum xiamenense]NJB68553.1 glycerol-3-phosphate dehydrogenase [Desulfobaculum xiamenense]
MQTRVLIIGGGATGTGLARDLALRGVRCVVAEMGDVNAGASGGNHGLLHSGARYVQSDPHSAAECREEGELLRKLAPQCIDDTGGLFVAVAGDDESYVAGFPGWCAAAGVPCRGVSVSEAREMEPEISPHAIAAFEVRDASIDPFRLSLENLWHARDLGCTYIRRNRVDRFDIEGGRIRRVVLRHVRTGAETIVEPELVVSASGAWAANVAQLAGIRIPMLYSKGTLLVTHERMATRVINRLRPPGNGDILVPGGTVSVLGTTSIRLEALDEIRPTMAEVDENVDEGAAMVPRLGTTRYIRAYAGVRPLIGEGGGEDDRGASRGFGLYDHARDGVENFVTITGGKLTTFRLMAEKTADLVCERLGVDAPCLTRSMPLPVADRCRWTEPGLSPREWAHRSGGEDGILCECEMVPRSTVDDILGGCREFASQPALRAIGLRSRVGKGACQGAFCGMRVGAHLYDEGVFDSPRGLLRIREFLSERFKGQRPVLWGVQLAQAELAEAMHCGLLGLDLLDEPPSDGGGA